MLLQEARDIIPDPPFMVDWPTEGGAGQGTQVKRVTACGPVAVIRHAISTPRLQALSSTAAVVAWTLGKP